MTFTREHGSHVSYSGISLISQTEILTDLGIYFDPRLDFEFRSNKILTYANKTWYNILRNCKDFSESDKNTISKFSSIYNNLWIDNLASHLQEYY